MLLTLDEPIGVLRRRNPTTWALEIYKIISQAEFDRLRSDHHLDENDPISPVELTSAEISQIFGPEKERKVRAEIKAKAGFKSYIFFAVPTIRDIPPPPKRQKS